MNKPIEQLSETKRAIALRDLIQGDWPLEKNDRKIAIEILNEWIVLLEEEKTDEQR